MKFSNKLSLLNLLIGIMVVLVFTLITYKLSYQAALKSQMLQTQTIADHISGDFDILFHEKISKGLTLANIPAIRKALEKSNLYFDNMTPTNRKNYLINKNKTWKSTQDPNDKFILKYTNNKVSHILNNQQKIIKGEYGEIFLTNKFGALVASTAKLSTFAHGHKYWWLGAYNNGTGTIFLDDRGYDESVGGYVLGIVLPIKKGGKTIGLLKCNLNILSSINKLILDNQDKFAGKLQLIRSEGLIIADKDVEPLSTRVNNLIFKQLKKHDHKSFLLNNSGEEYLISMSEIQSTKGKKKYNFGGTLKSIDHKMGNKGEFWFIIYYLKKDIALASNIELIKMIIIVGFSIVLVLALVSYISGQQIAKPLALLDNATKKIGAGNFNYRIDIKQNDEFSNLGNSFNHMAHSLEQTTTSKEKAEESDKLKSIFLANMSHEIRTPLNAIIGFTDLMLCDELSNEHKENLTLIEENSQLLLALINNILDFSKIESGTIEIETISFSIDDLLHHVHLNLKGLIEKEKKSIEIRKNIPQKHNKYISGDLTKVLQVINNLISNAVKFTKEGFIEYGFKLIDGNIDFYVQDSGIGISQEEQVFIFDSFKQADSTITRKYGGTGLGLSISRKIAELLNGKLLIQSESKKGSIFTLSIPYIPVEDPVSATVRRKGTNKKINYFNNCTILIVEDNLLNQLVARRILEKSNFQVLIANDGKEAVEQFTSNTDIKLILMDIQMPVLDGLKATAEIREIEKLKKRNRLPIIALTAAAFKTDKEKALQSGCDDYISKPINREHLLSILERHLTPESK